VGVLHERAMRALLHEVAPWRGVGNDSETLVDQLMLLVEVNHRERIRGSMRTGLVAV